MIYWNVKNRTYTKFMIDSSFSIFELRFLVNLKTKI